MKRLSLAELKEQSAQKEELAQNITNNLESIKGGNAGDCHWWDVFVQGVIDGLTQKPN